MDSQRPTSVDEEVAALSRGADRDSLFMQAELALPGGGGPVTVRVRNLSPGASSGLAKASSASPSTARSIRRPFVVKWFRSPICRRICDARASRRGPSTAGADGPETGCISGAIALAISRSRAFLP